MSVVKISGVYAFFRILTISFSGLYEDWFNILGVLVIITLLLANTMGLAQSNAKRMLAYSSVSHAGYLGSIFYGTNAMSTFTLGYYLFAYALASVGVMLTLI